MMSYTDAIFKQRTIDTISGEAEITATYNFPDDGDHAFAVKLDKKLYVLKLYRGLQFVDFNSLKEKYYDELNDALTVDWLILEGFREI